MKNILNNVIVAFVALALTFATVSCKKNKNDDPTPSNPSGNVAPTVSATASLSSTTALADVTITATASDADGTVSKVQFIKGGTVESEDVSAPYEYFISGVTAGTYTYTVKAIDNSGASTTTTVNFTVNANNSGTNHAPTVTISSKKVTSNGTAQIFTLPVSDSDGNSVSISGVITSSNPNVSATYNGLDVTVSVPNSVFAGTADLTITITDGTTPTTATLTVNVGETAQIATYNKLASYFGNLPHSDIGSCTLAAGTITTTIDNSDFFGTPTNAGTYSYTISSNGYIVFNALGINSTYNITSTSPSLELTNVPSGTAYNLY